MTLKVPYYTYQPFASQASLEVRLDLNYLAFRPDTTIKWQKKKMMTPKVIQVWQNFYIGPRIDTSYVFISIVSTAYVYKSCQE